MFFYQCGWPINHLELKLFWLISYVSEIISSMSLVFLVGLIVAVPLLMSTCELLLQNTCVQYSFDLLHKLHFYFHYDSEIERTFFPQIRCCYKKKFPMQVHKKYSKVPPSNVQYKLKRLQEFNGEKICNTLHPWEGIIGDPTLFGWEKFIPW